MAHVAIEKAKLLNRLKRMRVQIDASHLLCMRAAWLKEHGRPFSREASMAKLKASEVARRTALECMQMMGGAGYASEYEMEHLVRQALPMTVYAGSSEIQREIIGGTLGL